MSESTFTQKLKNHYPWNG